MKKLILAIFLLILIHFAKESISQPIITQVTPLPTEHTINSIVKIPGTDNFYAVGDKGSMMLSSDEGENWTILSSDEIGSYYGLMDVYFQNSTTGFTIGEGGIFKTINGGETWYQVNGYNYTLLDVVFSNQTNGFCVGEDGKLFQSVDGGEDWTSIETGLYFDFNAIGFCNENTGFIVGESTGEVLKTIDGGDTWNSVSLFPAYINSSLKDICFVNETTGFITMHDLSGMTNAYGRIYKTTDEGNTWNEIYSIIDFFPEAIGFYDESNGVAIFENEQNEIKILYTIDGGDIWNESVLPEIIWPSLNTVCYYNSGNALIGGNMGQLHKTIDAGINWEPKYERTFYGNITDMQFVDDTVGFIRAWNDINSNSNLFRTYDGGENWNMISDFLSGSIHFINPEIGYSCYFTSDDVKVFKTIDSGENWTEISSTSVYGGYGSEIKFYDELNGIITTTMGPVLQTSDGGYNWNAVGSCGPWPWYITFKNEEEVYLTGWDGDDYTQIKKSTDGGSNWNTFNLGEYGHGYEMVFADDNLAFMAVLAPYILKSANGGESWYEIPLNTSSGIWHLSFPSPEIGYGAGDDKLMKTIDSGESWQLAAELSTFITDIHFFDEDKGWIVDDEGTLLKVEPFEIQFNPPLNFSMEQGYNMPMTIFHLFWDEPELMDTADLAGYTIYRNDTLILSVGTDVLEYIEELSPFAGYGDEVCYHLTAVYENPSGESIPTEELCGGWLTKMDKTPFENIEFTCQPNPFNNEININLISPDNWSSIQISIFNQTGKLTKKFRINQFSETITISTDLLTPGVYYFLLTTDKGYREVKKMIKL